MNKLLLLKHWQLFILLVGIPLAFQIGLMKFVHIQKDSLQIILVPYSLLIAIVFYFSYLCILGINLNKKIPQSLKMSVTFFKLLYVIFISGLILLVYFDMNGVSSLPSSLNMVILLGVKIAFLYNNFFCSNSLLRAEWQRPVSIKDTIGEFILLCLFMPVGLWIIQPRINKLFTK